LEKRSSLYAALTSTIRAKVRWNAGNCCTSSGSLFLQVTQHDIVLIGGLEVIKHFQDPACCADQEAGTVNTILGFAYKGFFTPHAKLLRYLMILVRQ